MRSFIIVVGLLVAVALGCGKKSGRGGGDDSKPAEGEPPAPGPKAELSGGPPSPKGPVLLSQTEPDLWPALAVVPPKAASYPNTPGGRVAHSLDFAADQFVTAPRPPDNVLWTDWNVVKAFKDTGTVLIPTYPRRVIDRRPDMDVLGPAGDATTDRDLVDAAFVRVLAAWGHYRERDRRWHVETSEAAFQKRKSGLTPRQLREAAERVWAPGREVRVGNVELDRPTTAAADWVVLDVSGDSGGSTINESQTTAVGGRVDYRKTFELNTGPAAVNLQGRVGVELRLLANAPLIIDLADFQTPLTNVRANGDVLIRVGPGVRTVRVSLPPSRRGLILARNTPNLRVEMVDGRNATAVVNY